VYADRSEIELFNKKHIRAVNVIAVYGGTSIGQQDKRIKTRHFR